MIRSTIDGIGQWFDAESAQDEVLDLNRNHDLLSCCLCMQPAGASCLSFVSSTRPLTVCYLQVRFILSRNQFENAVCDRQN